MSIKAVTYYQYICDFPGCGVSAHEGGDHSAWSEAETAREEAVAADWHMGPGTDEVDRGYCEDHPAAWMSDVDDPDDWTYPMLLLDEEGAAHLVTTPQDMEATIAFLLRAGRA